MPDLAEIQNKHDAAVADNQNGGVVPWKSGEKQSDRVFEVVEGTKYLPDGDGGQKRLGPGQRFHPTENQVRNGSLRGKARELTQTEMRGIRASGTTQPGADIGVRAIKGLSQNLAKIAIDSGLTEQDFDGIAPAGPGGQITRAQVDSLIDRKKTQS